jgi:hypothetical protein
MKILYVPHWLKTQVEKRGASQHVYTDVKELLSIVSAEDVGFYLYLNMNISKLVPPGITSTFDTWTMHIHEDLRKLDDNTWRNVTREWDNYDYVEKARPLENDDHVLTCDLWGEDTIMFTHVPPTEQVLKEVGTDPLRWLYHRVVMQYHPFVPFEVLADTDLLLNYLRVIAAEPEEKTTNRKFEPQVAEKESADTGA